MARYEKDEVPMLSNVNQHLFDESMDLESRAGISRTRSASISIPMDSTESYGREANLVGYTGPLRSQKTTPMIQMSGPIYMNRASDSVFQTNHGGRGRKSVEPKVEKVTSFGGMDQRSWIDDQYGGKNEHLLRSGQLGVCNDPYCTTCPTYYKVKQMPQKHSRTSNIFDSPFHNALYGDAKGWVRRLKSCIDPYIPGVMNPHTSVVQIWNKFFVISCLVAIFVDPLFFFLLSVEKENKCIVLDWPLTTTIVVFRSLTDIIYWLNILLQFRLAYIAPESRVIGTGELVDDPKKIAVRYLKGYFLVDSFIALPLPQMIILMILRKGSAITGANSAKNSLRAVVLVQYIPRLYRFLPLLVGVSPTGFVFETAWANFFINLLTFMLSGHVVGSCWYLFGLQRVNQCLRDACRDSDLKNMCMDFIDCGHRGSVHIMQENRTSWNQNKNATACFTDGFPYGIYVQAVNLTTEQSVGTRYIYSLFWGFQQISTLAGNQVPSYFVWEVLFTMAIVGLGLLLFAFLIGNIQNFLQALGRRRLEMSLRRRDVDQWMSHRRLPQELRRKVLEAERYNWAATRGINEEVLMETLPEDLQRDIRRHFFKFIKDVWIFALMDDNVLDAICERLKQKIYIAGSEILFQGGLVEKMVFIVRGKVESIGENGNRCDEDNVCGEELLTWCLEHSSVSKDGKKIKGQGQKLISSRTVRCLTNVEAFSLRAADLEEVTNIFARNLRNARIQGAIRYKSQYWREQAAQCIQVKWRYRQKRKKRAETAASNV